MHPEESIVGLDSSLVTIPLSRVDAKLCDISLLFQLESLFDERCVGQLLFALGKTRRRIEEEKQANADDWISRSVQRGSSIQNISHLISLQSMEKAWRGMYRLF